MAKMQVNDDGTITIPLRGRDPVTLDEPSMADLAWLTAEADRVDKELPTLPSVIDRENVEQVTAYADATQARTVAIYSGETPYGKILIEAIKRMAISTNGAAVDVDEAQLYGWGASPQVIRTMLEHFRAPLPGPASLPTQ